MPFVDAKQRFSNRVRDYARYRLGYAVALYQTLDWERFLRRVRMEYFTRVFFGRLPPAGTGA